MGIIGNGGLTIFNSGSGGTNANVGNTPLFSVNVATTVALPSCIYSNGTSGVGATLVGSVIGALPSIDTVTPYVGMTVLVKNQASALQNGLYSVDKVGDSSSQKFVLTRLSIYDETSEIYPSQINILQGSANINFYFLQKTATPVIGTDSLVYEKLTIAGLTYFTEAQNTSAPNATTYVDSLTAVSSTTSADISIIPKGSGSFLLDIPNGLASGGNKRGLYAVDLQMDRLSATQVGSGNYSFTVGYSNTSSNTSTVAMGQSNNVSGFSSVALGYENTVTGQYSFATGVLNTVGGSYAVVAGNQNSAADYSVSIGNLNSIGTSSLNASIGHNNTHNGAVHGYSFGRANTIGASATNSFVAGYNNLVSADRAVAIGGGVTASGAASSALGGQNNTASGTYSTVIGGLTNTATGQYGVTVGGTANTNSGTYGALCTGWANTISSTGGFVGGYSCNHSGSYGITMGYSSSNTGQQTIVIGQSITSSALYSLVVGNNHTVTGQNNSVTGSGGVTINGGGRQVQAYFNTVAGDAQNTKMVLTKRTTDATLTPLTVGGTAPYFGQNEFTLQDNSCVRFNGTIVGKQTGTSNIAVWDINGVISKIGTVTININNVNVVTNPSTWGTPTLTVNGAYGMSVNVIGKIATNIQWTAYLDCTEVVY